MARLTRQQDAFGQEIWDHFNGREACEIVERDDGDIAVSGGPAAYFGPFDQWPQFERDAIELAAGRVLDIGCGAGRVGLHLQSRGLKVTGIDNSPLAVKVCKARGLTDTRLLTAAQVSRKLGTFDTIMMYGNNFGLMENFRRARWLLRRFHAMTGPRACILAGTLDPYDTKDPLHLSYHRFNRRRGRWPGQARIRIRYKRLATPWFDYLLVSRSEMKRIVAGTGWRLARTFDSKGPVYVAVLEKEIGS